MADEGEHPRIVTVDDPPECEIRGASGIGIGDMRPVASRQARFRAMIEMSLRADPDVDFKGTIGGD